MDSELATQIEQLATSQGAHSVGFVSAQIFERARKTLTERREQGLASSMQFTYRNPERSTDPFQLLPSAKSIVALTFPYASYGSGDSDGTKNYEDYPGVGEGVVGRFARHDYYSDLRGVLDSIRNLLKENGFKAVTSADSNALVDREVAWAAGLGWYGKNSQLLTPERGSWVVLGEVVTNADLVDVDPEPLGTDCGSCTRCIDLCPTEAIVADGVIDANRCLAWLVQAPDAIPIEFRTAVGTRIYGCDECAEVCPPSETGLKQANPVSVEPYRDTVDLFWMLAATDAELLEECNAWYIPKRDPNFLRRTALVCLGNSAVENDIRTRSTLARYLTHDNPMLVTHGIWAARRLGFDDLIEPAEINQREFGEIQAELDADVTPRLLDA